MGWLRRRQHEWAPGAGSLLMPDRSRARQVRRWCPNEFANCSVGPASSAEGHAGAYILFRGCLGYDAIDVGVDGVGKAGGRFAWLVGSDREIPAMHERLDGETPHHVLSRALSPWRDNEIAGLDR